MNCRVCGHSVELHQPHGDPASSQMPCSEKDCICGNFTGSRSEEGAPGPALTISQLIGGHRDGA